MTVQEASLVQTTLGVLDRLEVLHEEALRQLKTGVAREFALAIAHLEDAIMRINKGMAADDGFYRPGDYEQLMRPERLP